MYNSQTIAITTQNQDRKKIDIDVNIYGSSSIDFLLRICHYCRGAFLLLEYCANVIIDTSILWHLLQLHVC